MITRATTECPHCGATGEEPGAPADENGVWLCYLCIGKCFVSVDKARNYLKEREENDEPADVDG